MIKQLNKWLTKLFGLRIILNTDYEYITNENKFLSNKSIIISKLWRTLHTIENVTIKEKIDNMLVLLTETLQD